MVIELHIKIPSQIPGKDFKLFPLKTIEDIIYFSLPMNLTKKTLRIQIATGLFLTIFFLLCSLDGKFIKIYFENFKNNHFLLLVLCSILKFHFSIRYLPETFPDGWPHANLRAACAVIYTHYYQTPAWFVQLWTPGVKLDLRNFASRFRTGAASGSNQTLPRK